MPYSKGCIALDRQRRAPGWAVAGVAFAFGIRCQWGAVGVDWRGARHAQQADRGRAGCQRNHHQSQAISPRAQDGSWLGCRAGVHAGEAEHPLMAATCIGLPDCYFARSRRRGCRVYGERKQLFVSVSACRLRTEFSGACAVCQFTMARFARSGQRVNAKQHSITKLLSPSFARAV